MNMTKLFVALAILCCAVHGGAVMAQSETPVRPTATYDEVNEVASRMYCPICEMEPLDTCRAQTCIDWRAIIAERLNQGQSEQEIIDYFVSTYGDRVVGIPEDETLRFLSLIGPVVAFATALIIGVMTFLKWRSAKTSVELQAAAPPIANEGDYRSQVEKDLYRQ